MIRGAISTAHLERRQRVGFKPETIPVSLPAKLGMPPIARSGPGDPGSSRATASAEGKNSALVKRGQYLVEVGGCGDCHTPWIFNKELNMPVPDLSRRLSGHPSGAPDPVGTVGQGDIGLIGPTFTSFKMPFGIV
jgi:hypothetical protein